MANQPAPKTVKVRVLTAYGERNAERQLITHAPGTVIDVLASEVERCPWAFITLEEEARVKSDAAKKLVPSDKFSDPTFAAMKEAAASDRRAAKEALAISQEREAEWAIARAKESRAQVDK